MAQTRDEKQLPQRMKWKETQNTEMTDESWQRDLSSTIYLSAYEQGKQVSL